MKVRIILLVLSKKLLKRKHNKSYIYAYYLSIVQTMILFTKTRTGKVFLMLFLSSLIVGNISSALVRDTRNKIPGLLSCGYTLWGKMIAFIHAFISLQKD